MYKHTPTIGHGVLINYGGVIKGEYAEYMVGTVVYVSERYVEVLWHTPDPFYTNYAWKHHAADDLKLQDLDNKTYDRLREGYLRYL